MAEERTSVLVVGGALTGLSSAVFLAWHGVPCLVVERHPGLLIHPRLRGITPRTVEVYRQVGLEPAIRAASFAGDGDYRWVTARAETLASPEYAPTEEEGEGEDEGAGVASPCGFAPIDQDKLEVLLRARAEELGVQVRFSTELTAFEQDDKGVTATITDRADGSSRTVRADYLIAADGASSPVRQRLGIGVDGPGPLFHTITALIEADLNPALRGRPVSIAYLERPSPGTILMAHDDAGLRWVFGTGYRPDQDPLEGFTDQRVAELVRAAAGLPDLEVRLHPQIPGTDLKVLGFSIGAQLAHSYRAGQVFLVGDAARIVPPTGGLGGSTGIQDAHNLAWKLAAVLDGQAGPGLLDSYHDERHQVGRLVLEQALARFQFRMAQGGGGQAAPLIDHAAVALGYRYRSSAVLGASAETTPVPPARLAGAPGTRSPHREIELDGDKLSTLDLYGRRPVLLAGAAGAGWTEAAERVADRLGVPLWAYRFGVELAGQELAAAHGIGDDGALLVRPDGFVAWRSPAAVADPAAELDRVLRATLGR
jgi:putative polyketide hydroxylase